MSNTRFLSKHQSLSTGSTLTIDDCSVGDVKTLTLYILSQPADTVHASVYSNSFSLMSIVEDEAVAVHEVQQMDMQTHFLQNGLIARSVTLMFEPTERGTHTGELLVEVGPELHTFKLSSKALEINEKLVTTLQNFRRFITSDHVNAFRESIPNANAIDAELYNRKVREYLMNIHDLTTLNGSYKSLFSALKFFGYGELLALKEYWTDGTKYKSTDIGAAVLDTIDKSLAGFRKTNQLSLTYQINEQQGFDEYGMPEYVTVFEDTDEILSKMRSVKRILEAEFLPLQSHIVDIIGEMQTVSGVKIDLAIDRHTAVNIKPHGNSAHLSYTSSSELVEIIRHDVIIDPAIFVNDVNNDPDSDNALLDLEPEYMHILHDNVFAIDYLHTDETSKDFDTLTRRHVDDFALIQIDVESPISDFQMMYYTVENLETGEVHRSEYTSARPDIKIGVRDESDYSVIVHFIDGYGNHSLIKLPEVKVRYKEMRLRIGKLADDGESTMSPAEAWSTYGTVDDRVQGTVVPFAQEQLDINTWDQTTNTPHVESRRRYIDNYDMLSINTSLNRMLNVSLDSSNTALRDLSSEYFVAVIDLQSDITDDGSSDLIYIDDEHGTLNFTVDADDGTGRLEESELHLRMVQKLQDSVLNETFTFTLGTFVDETDGNMRERTVIYVKSREVGFQKRMCQWYTTLGTFAESFNVNVFSNVDAVIQMPAETFDYSVSTEVPVIVNGVTELHHVYDFESFAASLQDKHPEFLVTTITNYMPACIRIFSSEDITIESEHFLFCKKFSDVARGDHMKVITTMQSGSDVMVGSVMFAMIDNLRKTDVSDITWELTDSMTGHVITTQRALAFRYLLTEATVYSLTCTFYRRGKKYIFTNNGVAIGITAT